MIDQQTVNDFLRHHRVAVVGASADNKSFGHRIYRTFIDHGYDTVPVNPSVTTIEGETCYPSVADVPGDLEAVLVMVPPSSAKVVGACAERGVKSVWLFRGLGGKGSVTDEAVDRCRQHDMSVVPGACPLMFLESVGWFHRAHRAMRRLNRSLVVHDEGSAR